MDRAVHLTLAGLILFVLANVYPFMTLQIGGRTQENTLMSGVFELWQRGMWPLSILVFVTSVAAPLARILGLLYVLLPLKFNFRSWGSASVFRFMDHLLPWSMMEVYLLGVLVAVVKLAQMATLVPGIAIWSFGCLILVITAAGVALDPREVWGRLEVRK